MKRPVTYTSKLMKLTVVLCFGLILSLTPLLQLLPLQTSHAEIASVKASKIATVNSFTAALGQDGTVWTWGKNENFQLGTGDTTDSPYPQKVNIPGSPTIRDLEVGDTFVIALDEAGDVWIWGQMHSSVPSLHFPTPTKLAELSDVQAIQAGRNNALALLPNGQVWSWGQSNLGQGEGVYDSAIPAPVIIHEDGTPLEGIVDMAAAGFTTAFALTEDGDVFVWGYPDLSFSSQYTEIAVPYDEISEVTSIITGSSFVFFTTDTGVYALGSNATGQLGIGNRDHQHTPVEVTSLSGKAIKKIATGSNHTLVLMEDGTVWGAGSGYDMQLAELGSGWHDTFQRIHSIQNVSDIFAGNHRSFSIKQDGTVWAWGYNRYNGPAYTYYYGLLGTGLSSANFSTPLQVLDLMEYDTAPKPVENVSIEVVGYNHLKFNYDIPVPNELNRIYYEIYTFGESESGTPLFTEYSTRTSGSIPQEYITDESLEPGQYEVKIYTENTRDSTRSASISYDNDGLGYLIEPGNSSLSIAVNLWGSSALISDIPIHLQYYNSEANSEDLIYPISSDSITAEFQQLYPGEYTIYIPAGTLEDGTQYINTKKTIYLPDQTNMEVTAEILSAHLPHEFIFIDENDQKDTISGTVRWYEPHAGQDDFIEYRMYFENEAGMPIGSPIFSQETDFWYYDMPIIDLTVPNDAQVLRFYVWDGVDEIRTPAAVGIWDKPISSPQNAYMEDLDPTANKVQGVIHWEGLNDESHFENYVIINNDSYYDPYIVATIPKAGLAHYEYRLPFSIETDPYERYEAFTIGLQSAAGDLATVSTPAFITDRQDENAEVPTATPRRSITVPYSISFADLDPSANKIAGKLTWTISWDQLIDTSELYFMDESNQIVDSIAKVYIDSLWLDSSGLNEIMYHIPMNTPIPENAVKIGMHSTYLAGRSVEPKTIDLVDLSTSNPALLRSLKVSPGEMDQPFSPLDTSYMVMVDEDVNAIELMANAVENTTFTINGVATANGAKFVADLDDVKTIIPIEVTHSDGLTREYTLTVYKVEENGIVAIPNEMHLKRGESEQIHVFKTDDGIQEISSSAAGTTYDTSHDNVATVTNNGLVVAKEAGFSEITVTHSVYHDSVIVYVQEDLPTMKGIEVTPSTVNLELGQKETEQLTVLLELSDGSSPDITTFTEEITYITSDVNVVTVTPKGLIEANGEGNAEITVTYEEFSKTISVQVEGPESEEPGDGEPGDGKPGDGEPGDGEPGDGEPGDGEPGDGEPGDGEPSFPDRIKPVPGRTSSDTPESGRIDSDESETDSESTDDEESSNSKDSDPDDTTAPEPSQDDEKDDSNYIEQEIAAAQGGTVTLDGFVEVIIPPGALPFDGTISISVVKEDQAPSTGELNRLNEVLEIKSSTGKTFNLPIVIIFDYHAEDLATGERPVVKYFNADQQRWIYIGGEIAEAGKITIQIDHFTPFVATGEQPIQFSDLADDHWAKTYVDRLAGMAVIAGHGDGTFAPHDSVTRAQFVKMIVEALGIQADDTVTDFADDAEIPDWAKPYVSAAEAAGIVGGYEVNGEILFKPDQSINRAEMAAIISRVARLNSTSSSGSPEFTDQQDIPNWARSAIRLATASGIISGYPDGTFRPHDQASRAESAVMIYLMLHVLKI